MDLTQLCWCQLYIPCILFVLYSYYLQITDVFLIGCLLHKTMETRKRPKLLGCLINRFNSLFYTGFFIRVIQHTTKVVFLIKFSRLSFCRQVYDTPTMGRSSASYGSRSTVRYVYIGVSQVFHSQLLILGLKGNRTLARPRLRTRPARSDQPYHGIKCDDSH